MASESRQRTSLQLSPHFNLSEWLHSTTIPEVAYYQPTDTEVRNAQTLAVKVLEPLRRLTGPIQISGGARPDSVRDSQGRGFVEALRAAGYRPSETSDHRFFSGVDITFPQGTAETYRLAYGALQRNPDVRQVILYLHTQEDGTTRPSHIHISAVVPGLSSMRGRNAFAFVDLDGQAVV